MSENYQHDVFISYSHIDNQPFGQPERRWVDFFHEQLQNFVSVHMGRRARIWRDPRISSNEVLTDAIRGALLRSASFVSILSPSYLQSDWCRTELMAFQTAAEGRDALRVGNDLRVVKVLRLPIAPGSLPAAIETSVGTPFYRIDSKSPERARDLLLDPAADAMQVFLARVDDVANDLARLLTAMTRPEVPSPPPFDTVYLAWTTSDLAVERERLARELRAQRYCIVPAGEPPQDASVLREVIRDGLSQARVSIHFIGGRYGFVPEGETASIVELQLDDEFLASRSAGVRVVWCAPWTEPPEPRVSSLLERMLRSAPGRVVDVLTNKTVEDLKTLVMDRLKTAPKGPAVFSETTWPHAYLVCEPADRARVAPIQEFLFDESIEVRLPLFEGDAEQIRAEHYATLQECDGVLIFWGLGNEAWLFTLLRDLRKVRGLGRNTAFKATWVYIPEPRTPSKQTFRTHELLVVNTGAEFDAAALRPFVDALREPRS